MAFGRRRKTSRHPKIDPLFDALEHEDIPVLSAMPCASVSGPLPKPWCVDLEDKSPRCTLHSFRCIGRIHPYPPDHRTATVVPGVYFLPQVLTCDRASLSPSLPLLAPFFALASLYENASHATRNTGRRRRREDIFHLPIGSQFSLRCSLFLLGI